MKKAKIDILYFISILILLLGMTGCTVKSEDISAKDSTLSAEIKELGTPAPMNPEPASETGSAPAAQTLDEAIAEVILQHNSDKYPANDEACGEGHIIMDTVQDGDKVKVYALTMYGTYQFQDGNFVKDSGSGVIPAAIQFRKEDSGGWELEDYQEPLDGGLYGDSIRSMFPDGLWERCISTQEDDEQELKRQERSYAEAYLKTLGRNAAIGDYSDFPHTIPSDVGISTEVSNKIDEVRKYAEDPLSYAPFWFGTVEQVEDGVRYLYEHRYDAEKNELLFSKIEYETQEIVEQTVFDSYTGEQKN